MANANLINATEIDWSGIMTRPLNSLGTVFTVSQENINNTAAAAGAQQVSPGTIWTGQGWATTPVASQTVKMGLYVFPVQGAANPTGALHFLSSINGAAFSSVGNISSAGILTTSAALVAGGNINTLSAGLLVFGNNGIISSPVDGIIRLANNAQNNFTRLTLGGTTSSFPSIKRNGTGVDIRLADDTAYAPLTTGNLTTGVAATISIVSGTNQRAGNLTLVGGTLTVGNTTVTANTIVMLTRKTSGGTIGTAITYTISAGASFTVTSDNVLDTSTFSYLLIEVP